MVGAVLVTHAFICRELIATIEYLLGNIDGIVAVSIHADVDVFKARTKIWRAMKEVDQGDGVLVMTDLFGGTPSNLALSFLGNENVEVITGVNLPMLLTFCTRRSGMELAELAKAVQLSGTRSIARAKDLMDTSGASKTNALVPETRCK
jgi:PTS system mannose-specific IIA component